MIKNNFRQSLASIFLVFALAFPLACGGGLSQSTRAQEASPSSSPTPATQAVNKIELHQALLDLTNTWTVMCVAAHPDDEDGTTLTALRRKNGVHTVSLFSTYGEGGQNAVGPELYEELGVIRAQETMKAAGIQGSEPYFLGLKDFGFSKSADEAFKFWGHDEALRRMVLKIRELRPDVIITHHDTTTGHGHHQATGRLIIEAFDAAADPQRFPEQLGQVKPWQAQRLFVRIFGGANAQKPEGQAEPDKIVTIDPNEMDPVRGTSFAEQALVALQQHATQGPWPKTMADMLRARRIEGGKLPPIRYRLIREASSAPTLPVNATTPLDGLDLARAPEAFQPEALPQIDGRPLTDFVDQPDRVFAALIDWRASHRSADSSAKGTTRFRLFESRSNHALAIASGVTLTLNSAANELVPGVDTTFSINLSNSGLRSIHVDELRLDSWGQTVRPDTAEDLLPDTETVVRVDRTTPNNARFTVPKEEHLYDNLFLGQRTDAVATLQINGAQFSVSSGLALDVVPAVELKKITPSPCVRTEETLGRCRLLNVSLVNHLAAPFRGTVRMTASSYPDLHGYGVNHQLVLGPNELRNDTLSTRSPIPTTEMLPHLRKSGSVMVSIHRLDSAALITQRTVPVIFSAARVVPNLHVGYVSSFDETLKNSLAALGVDAKELTVADIQKGELSAYQTIIIDNRGYEAHPELIAANSGLLEFVNAGGTLLVLYHKSNEWNPDPNKRRPQLAPYPIVLGDERVTDETAPVKFLVPRHPLLNVPNRIRQADFANWIQERGLYYPKEWDSHYVSLFSTNDPGESPLKGGLLVAQYGKGNYIYTSMVWYRELRAGVPGAYRMFANMISYGHK
jgi:LmbE family N-acetylglucosaminyl deacetylase